MKKIGITRITKDNPMLTSYVKTINSWEASQKFNVEDNGFYGVFLDDQFLAASTMQYDPNTSNVEIFMLNGSNQNYDRIQEESSQELINIALSQYGASTANISNVERVNKAKVKSLKKTQLA